MFRQDFVYHLINLLHLRVVELFNTDDINRPIVNECKELFRFRDIASSSLLCCTVSTLISFHSELLKSLFDGGLFYSDDYC